MANLISFGDLLGQSLDLYEKNWKKLSLLTLWVFLGVLIGEIPNLGLAFLARNQETAVAIGMQLLGMLILLVCVLPPTIRLNLVVLKLAKGEGAEATPWNKTFALLLPTIIVSLLQGLLTLGGFILLIIPGIWLSVALGFATYALWDEGTKGLGALKRSYQLVKGRWWATLVRLLVPHFLIGMVWFVAFMVAALCIAILTVLGLMLIGLLGTVSPLAANIASIVGLILLVVSGLAAYFIPLIVMTPLSMIPSVKVYLNLKSTR
jgi:hypothetical protein